MKFFKFILFTLLAIIVLPIALICGCFLTGEGDDVSKYKNFDQNTLIDNKLHSALDSCKENKGLSFTFNEDDISSLLYNIVDTKIKTIPTVGNYIKKAYCKYNDKTNKWNFTVVAGWNFLNTQVMLPANLEEEDGNLCFKFDMPTIGRINFGFLQKYVASFAQKINLESTIKNALGSGGIGLDDVKVDFTNGNIISIPKTSLLNLVSKNITVGEEETNILLTLFKVFMNEGKELLEIVSDKEFGIKLNMEPLEGNPNKRDVLTNFRNKMHNEYLVNAKKEETVAAAKAAVIDSIDNDPLKTGAETSFGSLSDNSDNITTWISSQPKSGDSKEIIKITSTELFNYFRGTELVGDVIFPSPLETSTNVDHLSYVVVDSIDFKFDATNKKVIISITINVNNEIITGTIEYDIPTINSTTITLGESSIANNKMCIGSKVLSETTKTPLVKLMHDKTGEDSKDFTIKESGQISFKIDNIVNNTTLLNTIKNKLSNSEYKITMECADDANDPYGCIKLSLVKN